MLSRSVAFKLLHDGCSAGAGALTVCHVRRREVVVDKKGRVFGHAEVNHIGRGLEGGHGLLVGYLLQTGGVHLHTHTHARSGH